MEPQKVWNKWDIPAYVGLSLFLQVLLVLFASWRQRSRNPFLQLLIWSSYLAADWVAAQTIGYISKAHKTTPFWKQELYAFWACFLLLHLGGPDTITSFALEDNQLWVRHLIGLIRQSLAAAYSIFLIFLNRNNIKLIWLPTIIVFIVGGVKYAERAMSLFLASLDQFLATADVNGDKINQTGGGEFDFDGGDQCFKLLLVSYSLFQSFKVTIASFIFGSKALKYSTDEVFGRIKSSSVGFKVVEYELGFLYEVLHTKVAVVRSRIGFILRLSSFVLIFVAFLVFHFVVVVEKKGHDHEFGGLELSLTYALLIGALLLDAISGIQLMLFSDCILVRILVSKNALIKRCREYIPKCVLKRKRWCGSVSQYNAIDYCLHERWIWKCSNKFPNFVRTMVDKFKFFFFSSSADDIEKLKAFIYGELQQSLPHNFLELVRNKVDGISYAKTLLQFHLATEICYHHQRDIAAETAEARKMCKMISDYMFYLLMEKPEMLGLSSGKAKWKKVVEDTFGEMESQLMKHKICDHAEACSHFMTNYVGKSGKCLLLEEACRQGQGIDEATDWKGTRNSWLFCLFFAAIKRRSVVHAQQPSKGGELLTFIRFLIHHFGLIPERHGLPIA